VLDVSSLDLDEIADALADQVDNGRRWLVDRETGQLALWTSDSGIDGETPVDLDELDENLVPIDALPSFVWYPDMADFAEQISDDKAVRRLGRATRVAGRSAGSRTNCVRSTRSSCRRGAPSVTSARGAGPSSGSWTAPSSTTTPSVSSTTTRIPRCRDAPPCGEGRFVVACDSNDCGWWWPTTWPAAAIPRAHRIGVAGVPGLVCLAGGQGAATAALTPPIHADPLGTIGRTTATQACGAGSAGRSREASGRTAR
jgi:hypothetical protein